MPYSFPYLKRYTGFSVSYYTLRNQWLNTGNPEMYFHNGGLPMFLKILLVYESKDTLAQVKFISLVIYEVWQIVRLYLQAALHKCYSELQWSPTKQFPSAAVQGFQCCFQQLKHFQQSFSCKLFRTAIITFCISSLVSKCGLFRWFFMVGKRKKSHRATSGE